jgi:hypothetical protein
MFFVDDEILKLDERNLKKKNMKHQCDSMATSIGKAASRHHLANSLNAESHLSQPSNQSS